MYDGETMVRHGVAQSSAFRLGLLPALIYGGTMWGTSSPMAQETDTGITEDIITRLARFSDI